MSTNKHSLNLFISLLMAGTTLFTSCNDPAVPSQRAGILEGAPNFRDLGGYPSANGLHTAWRKVFRSQALAQISDSDLVRLKESDIRTVIDFRSDDEVRKAPSRLPGGATLIRLPIDVGRSDSLQIMQLLATGALDSAQSVAYMQTANRRFVTDFAPEYRQFFDILLQPESYPVVFHCTAGKDRTGFAAALLLSALDVDWDTVMGDYLLTNQYLKPSSVLPQIPESALPALRPLLGVHPSYLDAAREEIAERYGSIDQYLQQELHIGPAEKARLKEYLLDE
ncbi:MAG: tyrosine-protein phosphatase [Tannerellaceae bacterium]|nr:tyrosine-protein phosphatase [Tannerellaceae bacterium]